MRNRKIRILHEGNEYYLVDRGRTRASRVITFLKRLDKDKAADDELHPDGSVLVKTDVGDCVAIASWQQGNLVVQEPQKHMKAALAEIVERYLEEFRVGRKRTATRTYYFLSVDKQPLFSLSNAQPTGLSAVVYSSEDAATAAAGVRRGIESRPIAVEAVGDLFDFLSARATEGFAGATLDDSDPIYFCLDESGAPRFLRLSLDAESGRLEHRLLEADGTWSIYEGEEELTPQIDQDIVDLHMVDRFGEVPFLGWHEGIRLWRAAAVAHPDELVAVSIDGESDEKLVTPLFHDEDMARAFLQENLGAGHELVAVTDLKALCRQAEAAKRVVQLHPGAHRARSATLWMHGDELILDSFSGLWTSTDGVTFAKSESGSCPA